MYCKIKRRLPDYSSQDQNSEPYNPQVRFGNMHESIFLFAWLAPLRLRAARKISQVSYLYPHLTWHEKLRLQITHLQGQLTASDYFQYD